MSTKSKKRLLEFASVFLMFLGFVVVPGGFGFWSVMHPERSIGFPLLLVIVHLFVCVVLIFAIADYWKILDKSEELKKEEKP